MHDVYFGTDRDAVASADTTTPDIYKGRQSETNFNAGELDVRQTYYWRIDEFNSVSGITGGLIWSFSTLPAIPISDPNLVGWWTFEGILTPFVDDSSGHDNIGILVGDPQQVAGYDGDALYLDGDDFMRMDDAADDVTGDAITLSAWVKTTTSDSDWYSCNTADGSDNVLIFAIVDGEAAVLDADGNPYEGLPTRTVNDNQWHMLTYVKEGATGYIYVDGVLENTHDAEVNMSPDDRWSLGQEWDDSESPTEFLTGTIDDARLYNRALTELDIYDVMRIDPNRAWAPSPQQGAILALDEMPELEWSAGDNAQMHDIYFGTDRDAVASADTTTPGIYKGRQSATSFDAGDLELGTTYFWRIDEIISGKPPTIGIVWSFTIDDYLVVDDFESYTIWSIPGDNIFETWRDGFGNCSPGNGNDTGSVVTENPDPPGPALDGQSMKCDFDNDGMVFNPCTMRQVATSNLYSRIEAQTATLSSGIGSDWTGRGAKALSLNFHGRIGNPVSESLWVQLQDSSGYGNKAFYGTFGAESLDDFNEASWHVWDIDLADFGVELSNVVSIVVGVGDEDSAVSGGSGTIYIDDMRLYASRFIPERLTPRSGDYIFDGVVDYLDMIIMIEDWLMTDRSDVPLVAWYKLDGDANDSSGNGFDGTLMNEPIFALGAGGTGMSIDCNESEYVDTDFNAVDLGIEGRSARTITSWVSVRSFNSAAIYEMGGDGDGEEFALRVRSTIGQWRAQYGGTVHHSLAGFDTRDTWVHLAQVYTGGHSHVYFNGVLESSMAVRLDTTADEDFRIGRWGNNYFDGLIDDVRIYDKALSGTEIASVMAGGTAVTYYHPVESPMNLTDPEPVGSRAVNFADFAVFLDEWAEKHAWPEW